MSSGFETSDDDLLVTDRFKAIPFGIEISLREIGAQGWNILAGDIPFPAAVIDRDALEHNCRWMSAFAQDHGVNLAPHVKTTMAPRLIARQLAHGAWGLTVANLHQLRVCTRLGARRVIIANQVVGPRDLAALVDELNARRDLEVYVLVDSLEGLDLLDQAARMNSVAGRLLVLVELGYAGGRTGCRTSVEALALMEAVRRRPALTLAGLEVYEGLYQSLSEAEAFKGVDGLLEAFLGLFEAARSRNLFEARRAIVTAGGSSFYPEVATWLGRLDADLVLRSGCYVVHDHGLYDGWQGQETRPRLGADGLRGALEVWALVQSRPEPSLLILGAGKRDLGADAGLPRPMKLARADARVVEGIEGWETVALSDQHAHVRIPAASIVGVGDRVGFGVSHPCTTLDKWQLIHLVDRDYGVVDAALTYF
ncbi:alanine racemase [Phenylobacterium sp. LH3H17]|uniref:alanine racemase n=1 Tax=Phenylobacterium sp. LH3H17 TaxID=2903901 RepID=UPI0020C99316|nr:alanine racemase [Phenylobacterium sp. LH3H17]UTP38268.1 alanine racemase [Phenylobacterium sp. LH3H17]